LSAYPKKGKAVSLTCTVSGSFRRFLPQISAKITECADQDVAVLSPRSVQALGDQGGFVFLKGDRGEPKEIECAHLQAIRKSDFLYVVNPEGYIGPSATMEVGYALALSVPVFSLEPPAEPILAMFVRSENSIERVKRSIADNMVIEVPKRADLATLQSYIRRVVHLRGFDGESVRDVMLLLVEEVGELAKSIRREIGLKTGASRLEDRKKVAHELADCFIYLLDIANLAGIDVDDAFRTKEAINNKKTWISDAHPGLFADPATG
jgi:NTP pyrophosphatase (non-canonical NTP hydrolase)